MKLEKHTANEIPPLNKSLLLLLKTEYSSFPTWSTGFWDKQWHADLFHYGGYDVIEWYELPEKTIEETKNHQITIDEIFYQERMKDEQVRNSYV